MHLTHTNVSLMYTHTHTHTGAWFAAAAACRWLSEVFTMLYEGGILGGGYF